MLETKLTDELSWFGFMIREAKVEDAGKIAEIHVASWRSTYAGIVPQTYLDSLDVSKRSVMWTKILSKTDPKEKILVVLKDDLIVGFASIGPNRDKKLSFDGELYAIYLLESHQKLGLGKQLFNRSVQELLQRGFKSMFVWVLQDNPTCTFYKKMGGRLIDKKSEEIGGKTLYEVAYSWNNISDRISSF